MVALQAPQSFVVRQECQKLAWQNGFRRPMGELAGWARYGSTTAQGTIYLAASETLGHWLLALDHAGIIDELGVSTVDMFGPGLARYAFAKLGDLYAVIPRVYALGISLPDAPLHEFRAKIWGLPQTTEAERVIAQRLGQQIFRESLLEYWQNRCPLTGITDSALLRASHIIPWSECDTDAERLNVHNGLLLSGLWDAAFDRALVTFDDEGRPEFSPRLSETARAELRWYTAIRLTDQHRERLARHRQRLLLAS